MVAIYWFAILFIIAGATVAMVSLFYGNPYDVREIETNLMINKFSDCVSDNGEINGEFLNGSRLKENVSIKKVCGFNFKPISSGNVKKREQYYLKASFYELGSGVPKKTYFAGSKEFGPQCEIQAKEKEYQRTAKCANRSFYVANDTESAYKVNVLSAVAKTGKNAE